MSLDAAAITELTSESAPLLILDEWLRGYFDGNLHAVGNNAPVRFPKVNRAYGQSAPVQPLHQFSNPETDAEIRVLIFPRSEIAHDNDNVLYSGKLVTSYVLLNFWISAKKPGKGQSEYLAQQIANLLKAILANPAARYPLAEKGITHLQPTPPNWLPNADYAKRLVSCAAQLQYPILFGPAIVTPPNPDEQSVSYFHEDPLIAGNYLLGVYQWQAAVRLETARFIGWAPQTGPVVVELEVDGVLTGNQITIPVGVANQEIPVTADLGVAVNPGQLVRWKIISTPAAEESAWHVSLTMQVQPV